MSSFEICSLIGAGLALLVNTVVLVLLIKQVSLLSQQVNDARRSIEFSTSQASDENGRQKQQSTMEFISATMAKLHDLSGQVPPAGSDKQAAFLKEAMVRDSDAFIDLRDYLNFLEDLSVGANMEIFDKEVVRRAMGGRVRRAWQGYRPWIERERESVQHELFSDLEALAKEFEARGQGPADLSLSKHRAARKGLDGSATAPRQ